MSYEPTTWKDGDLVTSAKLNKIEQGIANGSSGTLVVHLTWSEGDTVATMDKTWQQIYDADSVVVLDRYEEDDVLTISHFLLKAVTCRPSMAITIDTPRGSLIFNAETADSYPTWTDNK